MGKVHRIAVSFIKMPGMEYLWMCIVPLNMQMMEPVSANVPPIKVTFVSVELKPSLGLMEAIAMLFKSYMLICIVPLANVTLN